MTSLAFTEKQGQYLAYIYAYTIIHRRPPAEAEICDFFQVSAPTVHAMIKHLEAGGWLARTPRVARSLRVLVVPEQLPVLRDPSGQPIKFTAADY